MASRARSGPKLGVPEEGPPVGEGRLRTDITSAIPRLLEEHGAALDEILGDLGIEPDLLDDPQNEIPFSALGPLVAAAAARTGRPDFGLLVGARAGLGSIGIVGRLAATAPDVESAFRAICEHNRLRDRGAIVSLSVHGGNATFGYAIYAQGGEGTAGCDQIYDGVMAIAANALRELCGPRAHPTQVLFSHAAPADPRPWRRFFLAPLHFDGDRTELVFPAAWLSRRPPTADAPLHRRLLAEAREREARLEEDLVGSLRRTLRSRLLGGKVGVGEVARMLAVHRRTLNRRLESRHTSVREVADELRSEVARQLVGSSRMPLIEIATALGYSDASGFTRAFRRWSGSSPSAWRERFRTEGPASAPDAR